MNDLYEVIVDTNTWSPSLTSDSYIWPGTGTVDTYRWGWSYPATVYMYQVKCPKRGCKTTNWLELDKISPCKKCGSNLKAVSMKADFEIEVD